MPRKVYEYGQLVVFKDVTVPGGEADWPVHYCWYEGLNEGVDLTDVGQVMHILTRLGRDGWRMVGAPQVDSSFVYPLRTVSKNNPPVPQYNSANSWIQKRYWMMRVVDGS